MTDTTTEKATFLDAVLERNRRFVAGRKPEPLAPLEELRLAVVACYDPRLDSLFQPALGYAPGKTFLFRTAGALVQPSGATLRSLSMAVYMFGVREVLVVGHTSCRMAQFKTNEFVDLFRKRGVARDAFGPADLREWAGAIPTPRRGVELSVTNIVSAPFLPRDLAVAGVVLDDETSALDVVVRPGETIAPLAQAAPVAQEAPEAGEHGEEAHEPPHAEAKPPHPATETEPHATGALIPLAKDISEFLRLLRSKQRWKNDLELLEGELARPHSPTVKFRMMETLARKAGAESREVLDAFERLKRSAVGARRGFDTEDLYKLVRRLAGKRK